MIDPSVISQRQQAFAAPPTPAPAAEPQSATGDILSTISHVPGDVFHAVGEAAGSIPIVGGALHQALNLPGDIVGWGAQRISDGLGSLAMNTGDPSRAKLVNISQYGSSASDALKLMSDSRKIVGDGQLGAQFQVLGDYQRAHDPQLYAMWQAANTEAQKAGGHGGEVMTNYLRSMVSAYSDQTPEGYQGMLDLAPELAFAQGGSVGQTLTDVLGLLTYAQKAAERSVAVNIVHRVEDLRKADPSTLSSVEREARAGLDNQGWTNQHAANYLVLHGQGLSHDPLTQLVSGVGLDPLLWAQLGTGGALGAAERAGAYTSEEMAAAIAKMPAWRRGAAAIGTTVAKVAADPVAGKILRGANGILNLDGKDLGSVFGMGAKANAAKQVVAATAAEAYATVHSAGLRAATLRAKALGVSDELAQAVSDSAMNQGLSAAFSYGVEAAVKTGDIGARVAPEDVGAMAEEFAKTQGKDLVGRFKGYMERTKAYDLNSIEEAQLAKRYAVMTGQDAEKAASDIASMSAGERALWHDATYRVADSERAKVFAATTDEEWGSLARVRDELSLGNPTSLVVDRANTIINDVREALTAGEPDKAIALYNAAAKQYPAIDDIVGRLGIGATDKLDRALGVLQNMAENGRLHRSLSPEEFTGLPQQVKDLLLSRWTDEAGKPLWELAFRPEDQLAHGVGYDAGLKQYTKFAPSLPHVFGEGVPIKVRSALADHLGRLTGERSLTATDAIGNAWTIARDSVSGDRLMQNMEQRLTANFRRLGVPGAAAHDAFQAARDISRTKGVTAGSLGGMTPDLWWQAAGPSLRRFGFTEEFGKREAFNALLDAANGDLRFIGLTSGGVQRVRTAIVAAGEESNALGFVTVGLYNAMRYAGNITFAVQAVSDAPWFSIFHGLMPVGGGAVKEGSMEAKGLAVLSKLGETGTYRQASLDFTERTAIFGVRENLERELFGQPVREKAMNSAVQRVVGKPFAAWRWLNRASLKTELKMAYSDAGKAIFDALKANEQSLADRVANAASEGDRALWESRLTEMRNGSSDVHKMLDSIRADLSGSLGRVANDSEVGIEYLTQLMDDSRLEQRTAEGLIDNSKIEVTMDHSIPPAVGQLVKHDLNEVVRRAGIQGLENEVEMRVALRSMAVNQDDLMRAGLTPQRARAAAGITQVDPGELTARLVEQGMHPEQAARVTLALSTNWDNYIGRFAASAGMTRVEKAQIEDMVAFRARQLGMDPTDYLSQILTTTAEGGVDGALSNMLRVMRITRDPATGEASTDVLRAATRSWADTLHPSAQQALRDQWQQTLPQQIEYLRSSGDLAGAERAEKNLRMLQQGWDPTAGSDQLATDLLDRTAERPQPMTMQEYEKAFPASRHTVQYLADPGEEKYSTAVFGQNFRNADPEIQQEVLGALSTVRRQFPDVPMDGLDIQPMIVPSPNSDIPPSAATGHWSNTHPTITLNELQGWQNDPALRAASRAERLAQEPAVDRTAQLEVNGEMTTTQPKRVSQDPVGDVYHEFGHVIEGHVEALLKRGTASPAMEDLVTFFDNLHEDGNVLAELSRYASHVAGEPVGELTDLAFNPAHAFEPLPERLGAWVRGYRERAQAAGLWHPIEHLSPVAGDAAMFGSTDVERILRDFGQHIDGLEPTNVAGEQMRALMKDVPRDQASPFNFTHAVLVNSAHQVVRTAERDAFRLANIQLERSVAQRSLNHPLFGLYPTSYMWGKVLPETAKFVARNPFGMRTTAAGLTTLHDLMASMAAQQEYDPGMKTVYDKLGKSSVLSLLSYLSPGVTWDDMKAHWPVWLSETAQGKDWRTVAKDQLDIMSPTRWITHFTSAAPDLGNTVSAVGDFVHRSDLEGVAGQQAPAAPAPTPVPSLAAPVSGTNLSPVLADEMQTLQAALFK
jgi:hypothetical protein